MGKVVVSQFISLDGVVEDPGGAEEFDRGGWAFKFDAAALRLVDAKPAGETFILIYEPSAKDAGNA